MLSMNSEAIAAKVSTTKQQHGQFFTMTDPFTYPRFQTWLNKLPVGAKFLEPFAGANNLVRMINQQLPGLTWESFDLEPQHEDVQARDTLKDFPTGFDVVITNPPYYAKNTASRKNEQGIVKLCGEYDDLYKRSIAECLKHADFVAAIIPESFLTAKLFTGRLEFVISLTHAMFVDTEVPVCLAVWSKATTPDFEIWRGSVQVGTFLGLSKNLVVKGVDPGIIFNTVKGNIGLAGIDGTKTANIAFTTPDILKDDEIKHTNRHKARILVPGVSAEEMPRLIKEANSVLDTYRKSTQDVFMTSFKGLRADGFYRRRLDYATARAVLCKALGNVRNTQDLTLFSENSEVSTTDAV